MALSVDLLVTALLGGAGVKLLEIGIAVLSKRQDQEQAQRKVDTEEAARIREELRKEHDRVQKENERLQLRLTEATGGHKALPASTAVVPDITAVREALKAQFEEALQKARDDLQEMNDAQWKSLKDDNDRLRIATGVALQQNATLLDALQEAQRKLADELDARRDAKPPRR